MTWEVSRRFKELALKSLEFVGCVFPKGIRPKVSCFRAETRGNTNSAVLPSRVFGNVNPMPKRSAERQNPWASYTCGTSIFEKHVPEYVII